MTGKTKLMAGVAAIATLAAFAPLPARAQGTPSNAELQARLDALEAELQQSEMRQASMAEKVDAAPAATAAMAQGWWNNTSISGRMYFDFTNIDHTINSVDQADEGFNFDIKRFYVGIDHKFNDVFAANITTDLTYDATTGASQIFIKKAYLQAKVAPWLTLRAGSADLPWVPFVEGLYGHRYVENVLIDRTKFGTSADWGVHAGGTAFDGVLGYAVSVINGAGYKKAPIGGGANRSESVDVEGRVNLNWEHFTIAAGGYSGELGKDVKGVTTNHTAQRFDAVAAYTDDAIRAGVEYFYANDWNNVTTVVGDDANGISAFASYQFTPEWGVFGRYDYVKPNDSTNPALEDNYYNVGISYSPFKMIDLSLVYKHDQASHGTLSTSNGTIGGSVSGNYNEVGLFGQFQW